MTEVDMRRKRALSDSEENTEASLHPMKRPRTDDTYHIINVQNHVYAALLDNIDRLEIVGIKPHQKDTLKPGSEWLITHIERNEYHIQNSEFSSYASCDTRPEARSNVLGKWAQPNANPSVWIIKPIPSNPCVYTISPLENPDIFWMSMSNLDGTPLGLDQSWTAESCQWTFEPVGSGTKPSPISPFGEAARPHITQLLLEQLPNEGQFADPIDLAFNIASIIREIVRLPTVKDNLDVVEARILAVAARFSVIHPSLAESKMRRAEDEQWIYQFKKTLKGEFRRLYQLRDDSIDSEVLGRGPQKMRVVDIFERVSEASVQFELAIGIRTFKNTYKIEEQLWTLIMERLKPSRIANHKYDLQSDEGQLLRRTACTPGTRVRLLEDIITWVKDTSRNSPEVYWLFGPAGSGKSTIAYTIARRFEFTGDCDSNVILGGNFFCSRQFEETKQSKRIVRTIAYQLALVSKPFANALRCSGAFEACDHSVQAQIQALLVLPWQESEAARARDPSSLPHYLVLIDALDEIDGEGGSKFLSDLFDALNKSQLRGLKFFATSRPDSKLVNIVDSFERKHRYHLQDVKREEAWGDIQLYLTAALPHFSQREEMGKLVMLSDGLFIYAATVVRYLEGYEGPDQEELLEPLLAPGTVVPKRPLEDLSLLDKLYLQILDNAFHGRAEAIRQRRLTILYTFLSTAERTSEGVVVDLFCPPNRRDQYITGAADVLKELNAVLYTDKDRVLSYHKSFSDFLFDQGRSREFWCDQALHHRRLTQSCFRVMSVWLRFNIANIQSSFILDRDNPTLSADVAQNVPAVLKYSCRNWGHHLGLVGLTDFDVFLRLLSDFLQLRALFWIEVMNLLELRGHCDLMLRMASNWVQRFDPVLANAFMETATFAAYFSGSSASMSTPHLYISSLATWPRKLDPCQTWRAGFIGLPTFRNAIGRGSLLLLNLTLNTAVHAVGFSSDGTRIVSGSDDGSVRVWDAFTGDGLKVLSGHTGWVSSVAFSNDGTQIVSGSDDGSVRVWDAFTGDGLKVLNGHTGRVSSVAFSSDGTRLISGSGDGSVRVWDASTGDELKVLNGHTGMVNSVALSNDGTRIVSCSGDKSVRVWDASTGDELKVLNGHTDWVNSVALSNDGTRIVSGSNDQSVRVWDASTGDKLKAQNVHTYAVTSVAFSNDDTRVVSGSDDKSVRVWDASTGDKLKVLRGHTDWVRSVAFSNDGMQVVSGSDDKSVRVWDASTGDKLKVLCGHTNWVRSVAFSNDDMRVVSGSYDKSVRVWDASTGNKLRVLNGHTDRVSSVAYSNDGTQIFSASGDGSVRMWDASVGDKAKVLKGRSGWFSSVAFSNDGTHVISGSDDGSVRVWDASTGDELKVLNGHTGQVNSVMFSNDGTRIVSGSGDKSVRMWDASTGDELKVLNGHTGMVNSVAFSNGGTCIVSGSDDKSVRVWDAFMGLKVLNGHTQAITSVAFSNDGTRIASGSDDESVRVWNASTGDKLKVLRGHTASVRSVAFSNVDMRVVSGSGDKSVRVWDASTGNNLKVLRGHTNWVCSVAFSNDGMRVVSGSYDKSVRVWNAWTGNKLKVLNGHTGWVRSVASQMLSVS